MLSDFLKKMKEFHDIGECPCLCHQLEYFKDTKPLDGMTVIHSSPVFKNLFPKIAPLLASGAEIVFTTPPQVRTDPEAVDILKQFNLSFEEHIRADFDADIIMDCAGSCSHIRPKIGVVELTKSGEYIYTTEEFPVISVDRSIIKKIEDRLGTSDGLIRALDKLNLSPSSQSTVLLFGCGKVGGGILKKLVELKTNVIVVDREDVIAGLNDVRTICHTDGPAVIECAKEADYIITCTGLEHVIEKNYGSKDFIGSRALLINMGAFDEYGPSFPEERILNNKSPLNFILEEPSRLKYLDATFALHNRCAAYLAQSKDLPNGISSPPEFIEKEILQLSHFKESDLDF